MHSRRHQTSLWRLRSRKRLRRALQYWRNVIASASCERSKASQRLFLAILCRADRRLIGGELNKSESPVRVRRRKINSARSRPVARRWSSVGSSYGENFITGQFWTFATQSTQSGHRGG